MSTPKPDSFYIIQKDDSLTSIAIRAYGDINQYSNIWEDNRDTLRSGDPKIIYPGERIWLRPVENLLSQIAPLADISPETASLFIDGKAFSEWESLSLMKNIHTCVDGFTFVSPFNPNNPTHQELFRPFSYKKIEIFFGTKRVLTGRIELISPAGDLDNTVVSIGGRSLAGSILDCSISNYPIEYNKLTLSQIANQLLSPFGIGSVFPDGDSGEIEQARAENGEKVFDFLKKLSRQKGFLISSLPDGKLVFQKSKQNQKPIASLIEGDSPVKRISIVGYDGQKRFSLFRGITQNPDGKAIYGESTDDSIPIHRPHIFDAPDTESGNISESTDWEKSKSLEGVKYSVSLTGWLDPNGDYWEENKLVTLLSPRNMIYNETTMLIESVNFLKSQTDTIASLDVVLPETYSLNFPKVFPWDQ